MNGEHQVTIRNKDCEKRFCVMLGCSRLVKFPIFIIFDGPESKFVHMKKKFSDDKIPDCDGGGGTSFSYIKLRHLIFF